MWDSLFHAIKGLPKRQVTSDISGDEGQPLGLLICQIISFLLGTTS